MLTLDKLLNLYTVESKSRERWIDDVARWLTDELSPTDVLIVGLAASDMAQALRQQKVEAWGLLPDMPRLPQENPVSKDSACRVGSLVEPLSRDYDLIICVEALTGLSTEFAGRALANLCTYTSDILFTARGPLYGAVDAPPQEHWAVEFLRHGFVHDIAFDATPLLPWAGRFQRMELTQELLAAHYERHLWRLEQERVARRMVNLEQREALVELSGELSEKTALLEALRSSVHAWEQRWTELESGILWPWVQRLQRLRAKLMPPGSRRERWLERLFRKSSHWGKEIVVAPVAEPEIVSRRGKHVVIEVEVQHDLSKTRECLETLQKCTSSPYSRALAITETVDAETRAFVNKWAIQHGSQVTLEFPRNYDADYVAHLNTGVLVTPRWLDYLMSCAENHERPNAVAPLFNHLVSLPDMEKAPPKARAELVARAAGGLCFSVRDSSKGCLLSRFPQSPEQEQSVQICDRAYVEYQDSVEEATVLSDMDATSLTGRVGLGVQARLNVARERQSFVERGHAEFSGRKLLFLLPVATPGGGANIVISEGLAMRAMGVDVELFNLMENRDGFETAYPRVEIPVLYGSPQLLLNYAANYDAVVATFNTSVEWLVPLSGRELEFGYYVQGFEPYIYEQGTKEFEVAMASYTLLPDLVRFTKTEWTRRKVMEETGGESAVVGPSIELDLFRPRPIKELISASNPLRIAAMVRPFSPYRAPHLTMKILRRVQRRYRDAVEIYLFGISVNHPELNSLPRDFDWNLAGVLEKKQMARLLTMVDIFADFSEHQAMGLTAMEAMACGNAVIVPQEGGAKSFAKHEHNALVIDTSSEKACWRGLKRLIEDESLRGRLRRNALEDIVYFHPERAAYNILNVLFSPEKDG